MRGGPPPGGHGPRQRTPRSRSPLRPLSRNEASRADVPVLYPYRRGSRTVALAIAASPTRRARARQAIEYRVHARSTSQNNASAEDLWGAVSTAAGHPGPRLTPEAIMNVAGVLIEAGFRSTPAYITRAKAIHLAHGHPWSDSLSQAQSRANRAALRGLGAPRRTAALPLERVAELDTGTSW